jgi:hypothetical protein
MNPFAEVLASPWQLLLGSGILFIHGWTLWFVLGQNFSRTLFMSVASRAVVGAGSLGFIASGALGRPDLSWEPPTPAWVVAGLAAWLLCWSIDVGVLSIIMRRVQPGWRWHAYDLAVLGGAHAAYLAGGMLLWA